MPPLWEELVCRGIMQTSLSAIMRPLEALLITAFAFSVLHASFVMFLPLAAVGVYLGVLCRRSQSLYPSIFAHFLHNSLVYFMIATK